VSAPHPTGRPSQLIHFTCPHCGGDTSVDVLFVTVYQIPTHPEGTAAAACGRCGGQATAAVTPAQQAQLLIAGARRHVAPNEWLDPARWAWRPPITPDDVVEFLTDLDAAELKKENRG
jgi:hypothetical protein